MSTLANTNYASDEEDDDFEAGKPRNDDEDNGENGIDIEDDDEEDEEEEDEDEEEEDDEEMPQRKRQRKVPLNPFIETEAAVDEEEEDAEEDDDDLNREDGFIERADADQSDYTRDEQHHRRLDRHLYQEQEQDLEEIAKQLARRHGRGTRTTMDNGPVPRQLLLPSVSDPSIWGIKCKPGKEREVVYSIHKKIIERSTSKQPFQIISVMERGDVMQGYVYVEARKLAHVLECLQGVTNCYASSKALLVPIKEMPDLLHIVKKPEIQPNTWARYKRGRYAGDLVQIEAVGENGLEVRIKMVPRLDYNKSSNLDADGKRKRPGFVNATTNRPPQRLFSEIEARKVNKYLTHSSLSGQKIFQYNGEEFKDGYLVKDVRLSSLITDNVNPTLEEVTKFASGGDDGTESLDLTALAASIKSSAGQSTYQPGDLVEVYDGEQQGTIGRAKTITGDIVSLVVTEGDLKGTVLEVPFKGLRKRFKEGDHVKVTGTSRFRDEVGMVVRIVDDKVTILSDVSMQEITVFSKDLKEAGDIGSVNVSTFNLHDLVQLDPSTSACIVKVDRESLKVVDQNGSLRTIMHSQVSNVVQRTNGVATDRNGSEIRIGDTVREISGESRTGVIKHLFRAFAFLHSRDVTENTGIWVARTNNLATIAAKGGRIQQSAGPDLTKMNPALQRGGPNGMMAPPPIVARVGGRDRTIGQTVTVRAGPYKGSLGIVKDASDKNARVELHARNKIISIEKTKLGFKDPHTGGTMSYEAFAAPNKGKGQQPPGGGSRFGSGGNATPRSNWSGSRTPVPDFAGGRTPAWAAGGGRTPAWAGSGDGGRTPGYAAGSKTPAWGDGSRSVYAGNRTPAWNAGSRTPYGGSSGPSDGEGSAWNAGSKTPGRPSYSDYSSDYSRATPQNDFSSAPTPGASGGATPASVPTPAPVSAPTPGAYGWGDSAPTPGAYNAPTPGASGGYSRGKGSGYYESAPTPGAYTAQTPGAWDGDDDDDEVPTYRDATPTSP